jgi:hypothetical protein
MVIGWSLTKSNHLKHVRISVLRRGVCVAPAQTLILHTLAPAIVLARCFQQLLGIVVVCTWASSVMHLGTA